MTDHVDRVRSVLESIAEHAPTEPDVAYFMRAGLYKRVLGHVAKGEYATVAECVEVAREALRAEDIKIDYVG